MNSPDPASAGEVGGIIAGIIALLAAVGKGTDKFVAWLDGRRQTRAAGNVEWERKLQLREDELDRRVDARLGGLEARAEQQQKESMALRMAFELVAGELRVRDPLNGVLRRAEQILQSAFPLEPIVPPSMASQLGAIDRVMMTTQGDVT